MQIIETSIKKYQFVRTAAAIPQVTVADTKTNAERIITLAKEAAEKEAALVVFPELCVTGYTCADLFAQSTLLNAAEDAVADIAAQTASLDALIVIGAPVPAGAALYNCALFIQHGNLLGAVPKIHIPNTHEFYERRWFASGVTLQDNTIAYAGQTFPIGTDLLFVDKINRDIVVGCEICEDLWAPEPPSGKLAKAGATIIVNPSASNELIGKHDYRRDLIVQQSARCNAAYLYCSCGTGESTTDLVFGGEGLIAEKGAVLAQSKRFALAGQMITADVDIEALTHDRRTQTSFSDDAPSQPFRKIAFDCADSRQLNRTFDPQPFVPSDPAVRDRRCQEIFDIQSIGLLSRIHHIGDAPMVVGISGGLDSTLALLVCADVCDRLGVGRSHIHAVTMPGFGTTDRTYDNAVALIRGLGATFHEISIKDAATGHLHDIGHDLDTHDVTYENAQARERTQILMDLANEVGGIVVGTGDLSELALGWATYNADHMSMYGVNCGIPKTLVRYLVGYVATLPAYQNIKDILLDVLDTPVSPELLPPDESGQIAQKTEDLVGPYELHDFFLHHIVRNGFGPEKVFVLTEHALGSRYDTKTILKWLRNFYWRFFAQQFKRSCLPDGPKVGSVAVSPRGDWRMPSDAKVRIWLDEVKALQEKYK